MRLLSCHIENFGKLSDQTFTFEKGLNNICLDNGMGKSTLATFIKVMFFGFENDSKRDEIENERKHFNPWQGGIYGGTLCFEANGKEYEIERVFKAKEKDDSFVLRDNKTKLESKDFTSNLGEQLFGINAESFKRSVFISQNECESSISDGINAKMGNLVDNTDDLNCYENVMAKLDDMMIKMSSKRKTGELYKINSEINDLKVKIKDGEGLDESIENVLKKSSEDQKTYNKLKEEQDVLSKQQKEVSAYKDAKANKEKYEELCKQEIARKEAYDKALKLFKGQIPEENELVEMIEEAKNLNVLRVEMKAYEDINADNAKGRSVDIKNKLDKYELKFSAGVPSDEEISDLIGEWSKRNDAKNSLSQRKSTLQTLIDIDEDKKDKVAEDFVKKGKEFTIFAIVAFAMAFILFIVPLLQGSVKMNFATVICFLLGTIFLGGGIALLIIGYRKKQESLTIQYPINPHILKLRSEIQEDEEFIKETFMNTEDFFIRYNVPFDEYTVINELYNLKHDISNYEELKKDGIDDLEKIKEKEEELKAKKAKLKESEDKVNNFVEKIGYDMPEDVISLFTELLSLRKEYDVSKKEYENVKDNKEYFEKRTPDFEKLKELKEPKNEASMEKNQERLRDITSKIMQLSKNIESYKRQLDDLRMKKEEIASFEREIEKKKEEYSLIKEKADTAAKTRDFMESAKIALTEKYTGPVTDSFNKYYEMITKEAGNEKYIFDAHINFSFKEQGTMHNPKLLSQGLKDLTGIALRMAFVKAMYNEEKPFVVFDDPFVNLDNEKLDGGLKFLKDISKDYQVIYFTCHEVRLSK